jgi:hypothetical protein
LKDKILSPTTIAGYRQIQNNHMKNIINKPLNKITRVDVQQEIDRLASYLSPKTVRAYSKTF